MYGIGVSAATIFTTFCATIRCAPVVVAVYRTGLVNSVDIGSAQSTFPSVSDIVKTDVLIRRTLSTLLPTILR